MLSALVAAGIVTIAAVGPILWGLHLDGQLQRLRVQLRRSEDSRQALQVELDGWRTLYPDEGWEDNKHKTWLWKRRPPTD